jgi:uncharacterized protein (TIGR02246 family)
MKIRTPFHHKAVHAIALLCLSSLPNLHAQDAPAAADQEQAGLEATFESLGEAAENFVAAYNNKDAAAIAALFTPQGRIIGTDGEALGGREAIKDYYRELFASEKIPQIALEASEVELVDPGTAIEDGLVHLTLADDEPVRSIRYNVTHVKQPDGKWLIAVSRSLSEATKPSERIKPLHWMIGEWTLEREDGMRIEMVIDIDDPGNHLLGEALITKPEAESQTTNLRIGWNPATSSVYWWTFDSEGGNASGPWARRDDEWVVSSNGVTADGEASASSQTLLRDGDSMVWISTQRILADEALPDMTYRFVRRAPDPISLLDPVTEPATDAE